MKVFLRILSLILCVCCLSFSLIACNDNTGNSDDHDCLKFIQLENGNYEVMRNENCACAEIEIPSKYNEKSVTGIVDNAFWDFTELTSITIPNSVKILGSFSFSFCVNLKKITIPSTITTWGTDVFACTGIEELTIQMGVKEIGPYAFKFCNNLTEVSIPKSVKIIGANAFEHCENLEKVTIGNGVKEICGNAFYGCGLLHEINYQGTVEEWNNITFGTAWNDNVPALYVICSDGTVNIK